MRTLVPHFDPFWSSPSLWNVLDYLASLLRGTYCNCACAHFPPIVSKGNHIYISHKTADHCLRTLIISCSMEVTEEFVLSLTGVPCPSQIHTKLQVVAHASPGPITCAGHLVHWFCILLFRLFCHGLAKSAVSSSLHTQLHSLLPPPRKTPELWQMQCLLPASHSICDQGI